MFSPAARLASPVSAPARGRRVIASLAAVGALVFALGAPAVASAKVGSMTDAVGDAPTPGQDLTLFNIDYRASGSLIVKATMAGPIDPAVGDGLLTVTMFGGKDCFDQIVGVGYTTFSAPDESAGYGRKKGAKKYSKGIYGTTTIASNVVTTTYTGKGLKNLKAKCFTAKITDPSAGDSTGTKYDTLGFKSFD